MLGVSRASTFGIIDKNRAMAWLQRLRRVQGGNILIVFLAIQIGCVAAALAFPSDFRYLASANVSVMLQAIPTLGLIALGVGALMIAGEFDLSVGSVYTFTSIIAAALLNDFSVSAWIGAPIAVAIGAAIGVANGLITLGFALPSFIVTLGAMLFWRGMILLLHGALSIGFEPDPAFQYVFGGSIGLLPLSFIWLALFSVGFHVMLQHRRLGNHMFAVGGNRDAAYAIGIRPAQVKLIAFALAGAMAAISGVFSATRVNSITPVGGAGLELQAIAACVIGGLSLSGGRGSVLGIFLGAALTYTIQDVLLLMRAPGFYLDIFVGALIVGAAILNQVTRRGAPS
jgi:ribose/xylose/arabinose/galactoside ABC-type transport system permease subunit